MRVTIVYDVKLPSVGSSDREFLEEEFRAAEPHVQPTPDELALFIVEHKENYEGLVEIDWDASEVEVTDG